MAVSKKHLNALKIIFGRKRGKSKFSRHDFCAGTKRETQESGPLFATTWMLRRNSSSIKKCYLNFGTISECYLQVSLMLQQNWVKRTKVILEVSFTPFILRPNISYAAKVSKSIILRMLFTC